MRTQTQRGGGGDGGVGWWRGGQREMERGGRKARKAKRDCEEVEGRGRFVR